MKPDEEISPDNEIEDQDSDFQSEQPEPEIRDADQQEELTEPEIKEISVIEFVSNFIRSKPPRWVIPVMAIVGVFIIAFIVGLIFKPDIVINGTSETASLSKSDSVMTMLDTPEQLDSGPEFDPVRNDGVKEIEYLAEAITPAVSFQRKLESSNTSIFDSSLYEMELDSILNENIYEEMLMAPLKDEYYELLNAAITPIDNDPLVDSLYYDFLTEPIEPMPEDVQTQDRSAWDETDSTYTTVSQVISVDTAAIFERIYTLEDRMSELVGHLSRSESENRDLQGKIDRLKTAHDSLRSVEVKRLAKIIEAMKPEKAAAMLKNRKSDLITELLFKVKPRTAAKLMENLPVDKRSQVTGWVMKK
ncbi:MAG: hypothetical protein HQ568_08480 [Calditrichaeota bacterium]|nr:hypothetical protein [Calditrichota bacterium]